jgi:hypothetical protein
MTTTNEKTMLDAEDKARVNEAVRKFAVRWEAAASLVTVGQPDFETVLAIYDRIRALEEQ